MARHLIRRSAEATFATPGWVRDAERFRRWQVVDEDAGAVHTGFGICELEPGGALSGHLHSFEESFFLLQGSATLCTGEGSLLLEENDYGLVPTGVPHAWRNDGDVIVRWAEMQAPQPRPSFRDDTYAVSMPASTTPIPIDVRDPRTRRFGHVTPGNMDVDKQSQELLEVSASMRTALLVYSGITVKMMVDTDLGARLSTMFMVRYDPDGVAGAHDHPFEETYLILEGEVDGTFDGTTYRLGPGDIAWAGVGCVHAFAAAGGQPVRWLETQAPQPPSRHSYRFARDWGYLRDMISSEGA